MAIHSVKDTSTRIECFDQERENPKANAKLYFDQNRVLFGHLHIVDKRLTAQEPL